MPKFSKEEVDTLRAIIANRGFAPTSDDALNWVLSRIRNRLSIKQIEKFEEGNILLNLFKGLSIGKIYFQAIDEIIIIPWERLSSSDILGRDDKIIELDKLYQDRRCRLINLYGLHGVGKNSLVSAFLKKLEESDLFILSIDLFCNQSIEDFLTNLIGKIHRQETIHDFEFDDFESKKKLLFKLLQANRHLIILRHIPETIQAPAIPKEYINLFKDISNKRNERNNESHQSCILLISEIRISEATEMECKGSIRTLPLIGLDPDMGVELLEDIFIKANGSMISDRESAKNLVNLLGGHPLVLNLVALEILRYYHKPDISRFLKERSDSIAGISNISRIYTKQLDGLDEYCKTILRLLSGKAMNGSELETEFKRLYPSSRNDYSESIKVLEYRSLLVRRKAKEESNFIFSINEIVRSLISSDEEDN
jgi:hypothetical protein